MVGAGPSASGRGANCAVSRFEQRIFQERAASTLALPNRPEWGRLPARAPAEVIPGRIVSVGRLER